MLLLSTHENTPEIPAGGLDCLEKKKIEIPRKMRVEGIIRHWSKSSYLEIM